MSIPRPPAVLWVSVEAVRWLRQDGRFAPAIRVILRVVWEETAIQA
ncbi:conserved hypothetical protein [metagenome]|uniref:Uncharacterized protein n=1 Tax=metagenome TaxID=256318 RepID=A0A2P2C0E4_9ZZZZ